MSDLQSIKNAILNQRKRQKVHQIMQNLRKQLKLPYIIVPLKDIFNSGPVEIHVRNEKCNKVSCLFDLDEISRVIFEEIQKSQKFQMYKCPECSNYLDLQGFYVDQDMQDAVDKMKQLFPDLYEIAYFSNGEDYQIKVDQKNEWILEDKQKNENFVLKESDMLTEYEKKYPLFESKQTPDFYENGYVFVNENIDALKNQKLQSVVYLFFPSLGNKWKEVLIFQQLQERKQSYFQKYMSVCKMYNKALGYHSIFASGGFGYPEQKKYERRTFQVQLFRDDPEAQIQKEVELNDLSPMITPRVFHQLVCFQGKVYAIGGYYRDPIRDIDVSLKSCERYDPERKEWKQISDLHHPRQLFTTVVYQNKLFIIGGKVQAPNSNTEEEDLTVEFFDPTNDTWSIIKILDVQIPQKYFTERAYCFVKSNDTAVIFGGRKEKSYSEQKPCDRSRTATELNLSTGIHSFTNDMLPPQSITFDGVTDFQGIYYNNRFIFGFKRTGKENGKDFLIPSLCKYNETNTTEKFTFEQYKKIMY
ncbi:kelch motif protein (macronuclear) [Tetrahymena thermophila SB210]|uniref:Kelch motif protein n=1 Tax=Tetrahymena thermophila (strain SB210) TaxID=312017 RepID=Q23DV9_TETTS|nr:kelch motif protein [Tetrahymena thermophila SB210]EAR94449.3 kelch motif protein [Tetrahymena thermophila SB210]|eukprot:XP_001014577.3 kelch motif protein [Tetrahymena thermophila SB210]